MPKDPLIGTKTVLLYVPRGQWARFKSRCDDRGLVPSEVIRKLVASDLRIEKMTATALVSKEDWRSLVQRSGGEKFIAERIRILIDEFLYGDASL